MIQCLFFILTVSFSFTGCFEEESFELIGSWAANDVAITTPDYSITADLLTTFTNSTFAGTTIITSSDPDVTTTNSGSIVSFSNSENWYIGKLLADSEESDTVGKYGMTKYILSEDGNSFTGTSYSFEDTEAAAKASTTEIFTSATLTKQ